MSLARQIAAARINGLVHSGLLSCRAAAKWRNLSGLRTTYSARITSPSISNAAVCTGPSGPSTMTPDRPLMVAKRSVKSSRHPLRVTLTRNCATRSAPSITFNAAGTLPPPSVTTRTSLASSCVNRLRSPAWVAATNADRSSPCFASISPERRGAAAPRGRTARTCARARVASCRQAVSLRSIAVATSLNEKSNTSCSRKAARSSGDSRSSVKSSAADKSSASSVRLSGASAAVSRTGSGSQGPTYSSRRARADVSISRQIRVVVVIRNALGSETWSRSAALPAQVRLLYRVLGVSHRPKHAVCETEQAPPVRLETRGLDSTSRLRSSRRAHRYIRRHPAVIEHHRCAANDDAPAGLAVAKGVLDRWIDSRGGDCKSQTDKGAPAPALHDRLAIFIGSGIVRERGAREVPDQSNVRRHGLGIVGEHSAQNRRTDAGTLCHCDGQLRTWTAVLVAHGGNPSGVPCLDGYVTPELSEGSDAGKQPYGARTRLDHVAHIAGIVVPVPLELVNRFP